MCDKTRKTFLCQKHMSNTTFFNQVLIKVASKHTFAQACCFSIIPVEGVTASFETTAVVLHVAYFQIRINFPRFEMKYFLSLLFCKLDWIPICSSFELFDSLHGYFLLHSSFLYLPKIVYIRIE